MIYINEGSGAQSHYRRRLPAKWLNRYEIPTLCKDSLNENEMKERDKFVFGGQVKPGLIEILTILKNTGKKVYYELDDDIWHIPQWNPAFVSFNGEVLELINYVMNEMDATIVTTEALAKLVPNPVILPNLIDLEDYATAHHRPPREEVRILWTGSIHHAEDLEQVSAPLDIIANKYPNVKVYFMGDMPTRMSEFVRIRYTHLGMLVPAARYKGKVNFIQPVALAQYPQTIIDIEPDIALLPLTDCVFNDSKSNIKYLECTLAGAVCVASDRPPYKCCKYRLAQNDTQGWVDVLSELIEDGERRRREVEENKHMVAEEYSWQHSPKIHDYINFFGGK